MLKNFQLVAILNQNDESKLQSFSLLDSLQNTLADQWEKQYETFIAQTEERDFTTAYTLGTGEVFRICPYKLPDWLAGIDSQNIRNIEEVDINEIPASSIKGIVAFARDDENNELMLFQNFTGRQVIRPGGFIFLQNNTYRSIEGRALGLNNKLTAVYSPESEKLLFNSFHYAKTFLPLANAYYTASNGDIRNLLSHKLFVCEDKEKIVDDATQFIRRRFAILKDSQILDHVSATLVKERAAKYNLETGRE